MTAQAASEPYDLVEPEVGHTCPRCGTSWTADISACPHCQDHHAASASDPFSNLRARLADHYLAQIVCDHDHAMDNPICACSRVHLGWHPSVGAAVAAWIDHVLAADTPAADAPAAPITRDGGDCSATIHGPACNGIHYAADAPAASEPETQYRCGAYRPTAGGRPGTRFMCRLPLGHDGDHYNVKSWPQTAASEPGGGQP